MSKQVNCEVMHEFCLNAVLILGRFIRLVYRALLSMVITICCGKIKQMRFIPR